MTIVHPQQPVNGISPEDVFYAVDDLGTQTGYGYILYQFRPGLYPDCPVNIYFAIDGDESARYLLFGALVARARVLQTAEPQYRARLYTSISPTDSVMKEFYLHNGFDCDETDDVLQLSIPYGDGRIPMSCTVAQTPLNTWDEQSCLIQRLQMNEITFIDQNYLNTLQRMPHFMTLGMYRNGLLIGEVIMAGAGADCELVAIYTEPQSRMQGMARALLHRMMAIMASEGVTRITTRIMSRSIPQQRLMNDFGAAVLGVNMVFPGMYLN
ncbi:MAG: hypothetical protein Q4G19_03275 [Clostridia bacterium]|nr:hypothetical protein [Clostridia bacterium]